MHCKDCKWWGDGDHDLGRMRMCISCNMYEEGSVNIDIIPENNARCPDGEWLDYLTLLTGPFFGCIHFTPKDGE